MLTIILVLAIAYLLYRLFFQRTTNRRHYERYNYAGGNGFSGTSMVGGMILGYLLSNALINQSQYDMWSGLGLDELRTTLADNGIMDNSQFDDMADEVSADDDSTDSTDSTDFDDSYASDDDDNDDCFSDDSYDDYDI